MTWQLQRGATLHPDRAVSFSVWAPRVHQAAVRLVSPAEATLPMERHPDGLHTVTVPDLPLTGHYYYLLDGQRLRPDPVSRFQPEGVHGPSALLDPRAFSWTDRGWRGLPLAELIIYELHVGTFTAEGTFAAVIPYLDYLRHDVGITAVELMPVAEFPGRRNWGYDGVHLYAPHSAYGGPHGLKALINACHEKGLAVILDVVYNHLGPEGNYLEEYGPYFTERYHTPWGRAVNFDGEDGREVRRYVIDNALYWVTEYHVDALRLDAIHGIFDASPTHILRELGEAVHAQGKALGRTVLVIAESDLNDNRVITDTREGGWGLDAQWSDDFHHALHALLTGERAGYYLDFGRLSHLATAITDGFVYQGQESAFRKRRHGTPSRHLPGERFVVCSQNHDQVGNRAHGDRLSALVPFAALKLAAGLVLCAPNVPLLFMGEEYGEVAPFLYFTSHSDPTLVRAVREGRRKEFAAFAWGQEVPDPQDPATFRRSLLDHHLREQGSHHALLTFYREVIALRKGSPALRNCSKEHLAVTAFAEEQALMIHRWQPHEGAVLIFASCNARPVSLRPSLPPGRWQKVLDAEERRFGGPGHGAPAPVLDPSPSARVELPPFAFAVYRAGDDGGAGGR
ncbi:MAG: malto-oligosyltrehalose trehalohydrolase [Thermodesulfobacteriota bacterium]|jgi:maltooligosyltrehalose trehalohydrolase